MSAQRTTSLRGRPVVALCGGVGGAKLALGLQRLIGADLTVIVNTGDDFEHLGLHVSPDIDTVVYTLGGLSDLERGWGRAGESWNFIEALGALGGETWFRLGDRDLAMHVDRTRALRSGISLTEFTAATARRLGIAADILPMSDDRVETMVITAEGALPFQRYFVGLQCAPVVKRLEFSNAERAAASSQVLAALRNPDLAAIIICPSNPYLSVDPILALSDIRKALGVVTAPIVAVSPLIGGQAVKGPTTKIMAELGVAADSASIARHYPFIDGLIIDEADRTEAGKIDLPTLITSTFMRSLADRDRLAADCLDFAGSLAAVALRRTAT
ncbi:2-phospho-L-lactate transferase [Bradyrhizobium sp.]|uniref:2-phospho-L-lactate transferase n=1 Tax=Bradyrhizobium sp. TaxID=376 RepID=UPI0025B8FE1A|nr:2-phospho-L-lactate transferase [Bradyrhizobium sp.]